ncbi:MAG: MscS family inner membrane protein YnaI [Osedax symbiont Rs2]|nr:MAG: MscS family inner membrane protein YnaI [Osedax symbiont Rs1]EPJ53997.1 MAG: MscS family inner membrane protein YnaI [Osedax symbiont Rs2]
MDFEPFHLNEIFSYLQQNKVHWFFQIFAYVLGTAIVDFMQKRLLRKLVLVSAKTNSLWDDALLHSLIKPITILVWVFGISLAFGVLGNQLQIDLHTKIEVSRKVVVIAAITLFLASFTRHAENNLLLRKKKKDPAYDMTTMDAVSKLVRLSIYITTGLVLLETLGFSISGVLAFGGIGAMTVGFAAKDMLSSLFGGMKIYLDRPFSVGDWIRSPDQNIEGVVERIDWRQTVIRTFDKRPLYVPNSVFSTISIENPSRMTNRRIFETIGVRYDDAGKMRLIIDDVKEMFRQHDAIDNQQTLIVNFNEFAPSSLDFFVYAFTKTTDWVLYHEIKQDIMLKIIEIIASHQAECAFPTSTIHLKQELREEFGK